MYTKRELRLILAEREHATLQICDHSEHSATVAVVAMCEIVRVSAAAGNRWQLGAYTRTLRTFCAELQEKAYSVRTFDEKVFLEPEKAYVVRSVPLLFPVSAKKWPEIALLRNFAAFKLVADRVWPQLSAIFPSNTSILSLSSL